MSTNYINLADVINRQEPRGETYMNLSDLNQAPPPPPPPRPTPKRPSSEPSDVALRSPPRDRRRNQNFNYVNMQKYTKASGEKPKEPAPPPPPPPGYSPKKPVATSPGFSPAKSSKSKKPHRQKEKEDSSKDESVHDSTKGKSPAKAHSPSGSEIEGNNVDRTHSPLVCFVRLIFYISFATFHAVLILWCLTVATSLHYIDVEFIEKKFMGHE